MSGDKIDLDPERVLVVDRVDAILDLLVDIPPRLLDGLSDICIGIKEASKQSCWSFVNAGEPKSVQLLADLFRLLNSPTFRNDLKKCLCNIRLRKRIDTISALLGLRLTNAHCVVTQSIDWVPEAKSTWADILGSDTLLVTWNEFWQAVQLRLNKSVFVHQSTIRRILDPTDAGIVKQSTFNAFCAAFGRSFNEETLVNAVALWAEPWFFGNMSMVDAERHLCQRSTGTFVVRFASLLPSDIAIAYTSDDGSVVHWLARVKEGGLESQSVEFTVMTDEKGMVFDSALSVVDHFREQGILQRPLRTGLLREPWFYPTMTAREAGAALAGRDPGTFLVRFSEIPGMFTVCFVDDQQRLCHSRIERAPFKQQSQNDDNDSLDDGRDGYRFVTHRTDGECASVPELIQMHSLVFRHAYTANKQRTMRARADKQAFDVADELPVPPDVEAAVRALGSTSNISATANVPSAGLRVAVFEPSPENDDKQLTVGSPQKAHHSLKRGILRRQTAAASASRPPPVNNATAIWRERWLVLSGEQLVEVDDDGTVRSALPLVTSWVTSNEGSELLLDVVWPGRNRRLYKPLASASALAFVARVRRRTLAMLGGTEDGRDNTDTYARRHAPHTFADTSYYAGEWHAGVFDGQGVYIGASGRYQGQYRNGRRHGYGTFAHASGETYTGEWKDDLRHGNGVLTYPASCVHERFVGRWRDDKRDGRGTLYWYAVDHGALRSLTCIWRNGRALLEAGAITTLVYDSAATYCGNVRIRNTRSSSSSNSSNSSFAADISAASVGLGSVPDVPCSPGFDSSIKATNSDSYLVPKTPITASSNFWVVQRHGFGHMFETNGDEYIGMYSADQRHGTGYYCSCTNAEVQGSFRDNRPKGKIVVTSPNDDFCIVGTASGPVGVFDPPGELLFEKSMLYQRSASTATSRRHSTLDGSRWQSVLPTGAPSGEAGAALLLQNAALHGGSLDGDGKMDHKAALRRAGDAWKAHETAIGTAAAETLIEADAHLERALESMFASNDNVFGAAYLVFATIFGELRSLPAKLPVPPSSIEWTLVDTTTMVTATPLAASRRFSAEKALASAMADICSFSAAIIRRLSKTLPNIPRFVAMEQETLNICLRASDAVLFPKIYDFLHPLFVKRFQATDDELNVILEGIRARPLAAQFELFGASVKFCSTIAANCKNNDEDDSDSSEDQDIDGAASFRPCANHVARLHSCITPSQKLNCLVTACRLAEEEIAKSGKAFGADELLPVLCFALCAADIEDLHAQFAFVEEFLGDAVTRSYDACMFTHCTVALNYLSSSRAAEALAKQQADDKQKANARNDTTDAAADDDGASKTSSSAAASGQPKPVAPPLPVKKPGRRETLEKVGDDSHSQHVLESRIAALQVALPDLDKTEAAALLHSVDGDLEQAIAKAGKKTRRRTVLVQSMAPTVDEE